MNDIEQRLIEIETAIANQEKFLDDLNQVVIAQGRQIDNLILQNKYLLSVWESDVVKPSGEEVPPPHY